MLDLLDYTGTELDNEGIPASRRGAWVNPAEFSETLRPPVVEKQDREHSAAKQSKRLGEFLSLGGRKQSKAQSPPSI